VFLNPKKERKRGTRERRQARCTGKEHYCFSDREWSSRRDRKEDPGKPGRPERRRPRLSERKRPRRDRHEDDPGQEIREAVRRRRPHQPRCTGNIRLRTAR